MHLITYRIAPQRPIQYVSTAMMLTSRCIRHGCRLVIYSIYSIAVSGGVIHTTLNLIMVHAWNASPRLPVPTINMSLLAIP